MIEFSGEFKEKSLCYIAKKELRGYLYICLMVFAAMGIPALFVWREDSIFGFAAKITLLILGILLFFCVIGFMLSFVPKVVSAVARKYTLRNMPKKITIFNDGIEYEDAFKGGYRQLSDVKKVIDMGDWYYFIFYFPHKNLYIICQKDLITNGSIEEFENLFADKLERYHNS